MVLLIKNAMNENIQYVPWVKVETQIKDLIFDVYDPIKDATVQHTSEDFKGKWLVLFFYPADFTFVCPTELKDLNQVKDEIEKANAELMVVSTDTVFSHKRWVETEQLLQGFGLKMVSDRKGDISKYFNSYNDESGNSERTTIIISPDGVVKSIEMVTEPIGRSSTELVRKLRALNYVANNPGHACPASWNIWGVTLKPSIDIAGKVGESM